ncbi:hypothetical protein Tco_0983660 [Tanacetum coccineum]
MSLGKMVCHRGTNCLIEKHVGPTSSLGIIAGDCIPDEYSPATIPQRHVAGDKFPQRHVAGERPDISLGKDPIGFWAWFTSTHHLAVTFWGWVTYCLSFLRLGNDIRNDRIVTSPARATTVFGRLNAVDSYVTSSCVERALSVDESDTFFSLD